MFWLSGEFNMEHIYLVVCLVLLSDMWCSESVAAGIHNLHIIRFNCCSFILGVIFPYTLLQVGFQTCLQLTFPSLSPLTSGCRHRFFLLLSIKPTFN